MQIYRMKEVIGSSNSCISVNVRTSERNPSEATSSSMLEHLSSKKKYQLWGRANPLEGLGKGYRATKSLSSFVWGHEPELMWQSQGAGALPRKAEKQ